METRLTINGIALGHYKHYQWGKEYCKLFEVQFKNYLLHNDFIEGTSACFIQ